jgi:hypothetical protein
MVFNADELKNCLYKSERLINFGDVLFYTCVCVCMCAHAPTCMHVLPHSCMALYVDRFTINVLLFH